MTIASSAPATSAARMPEADLLRRDEEVVPQQPAVLPQCRRHLRRGGQDEVVDAPGARVRLPAAEQRHDDQGGGDHAASASSARSRSATTCGSVMLRGRGSATSSTAATRAGRGAQHDDPVREHRCLLDVVRDEQGRARLACERCAEPVAHLRPRQRVEGAERLVEAQDGLAGQQRAQEGDALAHAARELVGSRVLEPLEPERVEQRSCDGTSRSAVVTVDAPRERGVVERIEPREQQVALGHQDRRLCA